VWRHQRHPAAELTAPDAGDLWAKLGELTMPVTLVRGMAPGSVVDDADEEELLQRVPHATVIHVNDAGHSIQGDAPLELAALIGRFGV